MSEIKLPDLVAAAIDAAHEAREASAPIRWHMGVSTLGQECDRRLWYSFRWISREKFSGRMLRLFRRGHLEEDQLIADLQAIGVVVSGQQTRLEFGKHVAGSIDGIAESGVPGAEKTRHLLEFKTHNKKSFDELEKNGVKIAKKQHWIQMQVYMHGLGLERALYIAVCKDDDRLHTERVYYNKDDAERYIIRGQQIALLDEPPARLSEKPEFFGCKFCSAWDQCHGSRMLAVEDVHCRSCAHSTATEAGTWTCGLADNQVIPLEFQRKGCDQHVINPHLVAWPFEGSAENGSVAIFEIDGKPVANGAPDADVFSSRELLARGGKENV